MLPPAPAVFSTMTGWPNDARMPSAMIRPITSVDPPGASGTTSVIGRDGKTCAGALDTPARVAASAIAAISLFMSHPPCWVIQLAATALLALDVGRLDDRPPPFDLRLLQSAKRLRRLLLARRKFNTKLGEPRAHRCGCQGLHQRAVKSADDLLRRALGHPQAVPQRSMKAGQSGLVHGRDGGCGGKPRLGCDRKGLQRAAADLRQEVRGWLDHQVDLAGDQILQRGTVAAIGHELEARAGVLLEGKAGDMTGGADTGDPG